MTNKLRRKTQKGCTCSYNILVFTKYSTDFWRIKTTVNWVLRLAEAKFMSIPWSTFWKFVQKKKIKIRFSLYLPYYAKASGGAYLREYNLYNRLGSTVSKKRLRSSDAVPVLTGPEIKPQTSRADIVCFNSVTEPQNNPLIVTSGH